MSSRFLLCIAYTPRTENVDVGVKGRIATGMATIIATDANNCVIIMQTALLYFMLSLNCIR